MRKNILRWTLPLIGFTYFYLLIRWYPCNFLSVNTPSKSQYRARASPHLIRPAEDLGNRRVQRAIVIFYPVNQERKFVPELRWLYRSWLEMMHRSERKTWRTDLVIFADHFTVDLENLACVYNRTRTNGNESPQCRVFPYRRISARGALYANGSNDGSRRLYDSFLNYPYIDSINIIMEGYPVFSMYDYILRTDIDVFLTEYFGMYVPASDATLLTGHGGYSVTFNTNRLRRIAHDLGWQYANMTNIGSTW